MSLFFYKDETDLPQNITNGNCYFTDGNGIFVDSDSIRTKLNLVQPFSLDDASKYFDKTLTEYSFAFVSDTHDTRYGATISQSVKNKGLDLLIHGGDYVSLCTYNSLQSAINSFGATNYLKTRGNHDGTTSYYQDDGSSPGQFLTSYEVNSAFGTGLGYYYHDVPEAKIRFIVLNTSDRADSSVAKDPQHYFGIGTSQMHWLCKEALQVDEKDWLAIIISHAPLAPLESLDGWSMQWERGDYSGRSFIVNEVITACNLGQTLDSTYNNSAINISFNGNMRIIANLCGHTHSNDYTMVNGIPSICIYGGSVEQGNAYPPFDVFTVDREAGTISGVQYSYDGSKASYETGALAWEDPSGEIDTSTTYSISCMIFNPDGKLNYIRSNRTGWEDGAAISTAIDVSKETITLRINGGDDSGSDNDSWDGDTFEFVNGIAYNTDGLLVSGTYQTESTGYGTSDYAEYKVYFNGGYYQGWSSINSDEMTAVSNIRTDFFGIPQQDITI